MTEKDVLSVIMGLPSPGQTVVNTRGRWKASTAAALAQATTSKGRGTGETNQVNHGRKHQIKIVKERNISCGDLKQNSNRQVDTGLFFF